MNAPTPFIPDQAQLAPAEALLNAAETRRFVSALFDGLTGWVNFRAFVDSDNSAPQNEWCEIGPQLPDYAVDFARRCASSGKGAFVMPAPVRAHGGTHASDVACFPWLPVDLDEGDTDAHLAILRERVGEPSLIVLSGGTTEAAKPKRHVYYRLATPVDATDIAAVADYKQLRHALSRGAGVPGDSKVARNANQILRLAGSVHQKQTPRPVTLEAHSGQIYRVAVMRSALNAHDTESTAGGYDFFNNVVPFGADMNRVMTQPILAEGKSEDGLTRFDGATAAIGHFVRQIRDGRLTEGEARARTHDWNVAILRPVWPAERIDREFDAILRKDIRELGTMPEPVIGRALRICDWGMSEYEGAAPAESWLVKGVFPLGEAGIVAGDGGIGKSFLTLDLCFRVATGSVPSGPYDFYGTQTFGGSIQAFGSAAYITAEESKAALHRRIVALDPHNQRAGNDRLFVVSLRQHKGNRSLIGAKKDGYPPTAFAIELLRSLLETRDLRLVILDPVSAFFGAEMNDRTAVNAFCDVLGHMASTTGATIIALHHMRKDSDGGRNAIHGSGGFVDHCRFVYTLRPTTEGDAKKLEGEYGLSADHGELVKGGLAKVNDSAPGAAHLYERQPNGLLRQLPTCIDLAAAECNRRRALLIEACNWYAEYGQPFTRTGQAGLHNNRHSLPPELRELPERVLVAAANDAIARQELTLAGAGKEKKQQWLCRPGGTVANGDLRDFTPGARAAWEARPL